MLCRAVGDTIRSEKRTLKLSSLLLAIAFCASASSAFAQDVTPPTGRISGVVV
jgi:hypothetical protein